MPESQRQDEINLMYVAATRARKVLITDPILHELLIQPRAEDIAGTSADKSGESEVSTENDKKGLNMFRKVKSWMEKKTSDR